MIYSHIYIIYVFKVPYKPHEQKSRLFILILTIVIFTVFLLYKLHFDSLILNEDDDVAEAVTSMGEVQVLTAGLLAGLMPALLDLVIWPWFERFPALMRIDNRLTLPGDRFPRLSTWQATMSRLPTVKNCAINVESHVVYIRSVVDKNPNYCYGLDWISAAFALLCAMSLLLDSINGAFCRILTTRYILPCGFFTTLLYYRA